MVLPCTLIDGINGQYWNLLSRYNYYHGKNYHSITIYHNIINFLNQASASHRPAHTWFLRIAFVHECLYVCVFACVCVSTPEAMKN